MFICSHGGHIPACTWAGGVYTSMHLGRVCVDRRYGQGVWPGDVDSRVDSGVDRGGVRNQYVFYWNVFLFLKNTDLW